MYLLGIDTSSEWLIVTLGEDAKVLNVYCERVFKKHVEVLHSAILKLLEKSNLNIKDIDLFVVVKGPGSFTGIRIAVTSVKGFGYALNKPCVSLTTLDLIARNAIDEKGEFIRPVIDARRNQVYTALYKKGEANLVRKSDYQLLKIESLMEKIEPGCILIGDGISSYKKIIENYRNRKSFLLIEEESKWIINPRNIIAMGYEKFQKRGGENIFALKPFYIYPKECTVRGSQESDT
jgi:tRNA threonylcarbamoyl adenosine modification protein YeaZ